MLYDGKNNDFKHLKIKTEKEIHRPWIYLGLFPDKMAPCFLQVTRGGGTPLTMHSSTAGLLMFTDTAWEPGLIVGATGRLNEKCILLNSLTAGK